MEWRWSDPRFRGWVIQSVLIIAIILVVWTIISNTADNLQRQGIASGFGFLNQTAGYGVNFTLIPYESTNSHGRALLVGLFNTILCAILGIILATIIGFVIGLARLSANALVSSLAACYVEVFRNIPLLLQIFFWYFGVLGLLPLPRESIEFGGLFFLNNRGAFAPQPLFEPGFGAVWLTIAITIGIGIAVTIWARKRRERTGLIFPVAIFNTALIIGLPLIVFLIVGRPLSFDLAQLGRFNLRGGMRITPELIALVFALSIYTASYIAEIVRAGVLAVNKGQTEAAQAIGLRRIDMLRLVIIPQALRVIIPPLTNQYLNLTKNSSLAAAIAYPDLVHLFAGITLNQSGQAVEVLGITMLIYLSLCLITSMLMNWYNARIALVER